MRSSVLCLSAVLALAAAPCSAQNLDLSPVRSVSIADADFGDLAPLGADIGEARIVLLGEQTHGDGATFEAKSRVIRYLHEVKGFDVLVFESGFAGLSLAREDVALGKSPADAVRRGVLPVWSESIQLAPLLDWLGHDTEHPMTLAGFDTLETGRYAERFATELDGLSLPDDESRQAARRVSAALAAMNTSGPRGLTYVDPAALTADAEALVAGLSSRPAGERALWTQRVRSVTAFLGFMRGMIDGPSPERFNSRDRQMADNLRFLAREMYPDRKLVVWAASSHVIKDRTALDPETDQTHEMIPAGSYVREGFGDAAYVLAFTSGGGAVGSRNTGVQSDVGSPPPDSLEAEALASPYSFSFSPLPPEAPVRTSWMLGYQPMRAAWGRVVDGVFLIRTMTPTAYPPAE